MKKLRLVSISLFKVQQGSFNFQLKFIVVTKFLSAFFFSFSFFAKPYIIGENAWIQIKHSLGQVQSLINTAPEIMGHFSSLISKIAISKFRKFQGRLTEFLLYFILDCTLNGRDTILLILFLYSNLCNILLVPNKCS